MTGKPGSESGSSGAGGYGGGPRVSVHTSVANPVKTQASFLFCFLLLEKLSLNYSTLPLVPDWLSTCSDKFVQFYNVPTLVFRTKSFITVWV